ncbi:MAG: hypothetical protein GF334_09890 [Candidatus Altiarchaeales archaeon]|nr:hypothetical protein [Candidatus Altiarchaeales archaeon]
MKRGVHQASDLADLLKTQWITYRELQVGDLVEDDHGVTRIEEIEKDDEYWTFLDYRDNGKMVALDNLDWKVAIIPREFLQEDLDE